MNFTIYLSITGDLAIYLSVAEDRAIYLSVAEDRAIYLSIAGNLTIDRVSWHKIFPVRDNRHSFADLKYPELWS